MIKSSKGQDSLQIRCKTPTSQCNESQAGQDGHCAWQSFRPVAGQIADAARRPFAINRLMTVKLWGLFSADMAGW
jgi:hypothetical protein